MRFRQFTTSDEAYPSSLELRDAWLRAPLGLTLNEFDTADDGQQLHFGLFDEQRIVASVSFRPLPNRQVKLRQMVVDPSLQRSGLGTALVRKAEEHLRERGFVGITMNARIAAKGFYEKLGYQSVGETLVEIGIKHVRMIKRI